MTKIAIIGAGIGGLTTAIALQRFGFDADIFEQAPEIREVGAAIAIWPNAMRVLRALELEANVLSRAGEINEIRWLHHDGRLINKVRLKQSVASNQPAAVALHRADLQEVLLSKVPASSLHLGESFVTSRNSGEAVTAEFGSGKQTDSDFLIGADGLHSRVRITLLDATEATTRGYTVWRGIAPVMPKDLPPNVALELHGEGKRFGLGPVGMQRVGWWASVNDELLVNKSADNRNELLQQFADWFRPALELIDSTPGDQIVKTIATDRSASRIWGKGRTTLLGDSIHPTTPNLGQGGCMAIEDAMVLASSFRRFGPSELTLRSYEQARRARTTAITKYSRYYGAVGQVSNSVLRTTRNVLMGLLPERLVWRTIRIVFDYDATGIF